MTLAANMAHVAARLRFSRYIASASGWPAEYVIGCLLSTNPLVCGHIAIVQRPRTW